MYIYKITNLINGKAYVGQTIHTPELRFKKHASPTGSSRAIQAAIAKYGSHNFVLETIDTATSLAELNDRESFYILALETMAPNGYNLKTGGANGHLSKETRLKISRANKGQVPWCKGKKIGPHSTSTRLKISQNRTGIKGVFTVESEHRRQAALAKAHQLRRRPVRAQSICGNISIVFVSQAEAVDCGFTQSEVSKCCRSTFKNYKHAGFYWRYDDYL